MAGCRVADAKERRSYSVRSLLVTLAFTFALVSRLGLAEVSYSALCRIQPINFEGWQAQQLGNRWVTLTIVPQLGGRLMQVALGDHPYLFVNPKLKGKYSPPSEGRAATQWYNFGGDKLWPLPEGEGDEQHWPGPISDALDAGNYSFKVLSQGAVCTVRLEGPPDPQTGLQYSREISLNGDSPEISFHAVMKNVSGHASRWSMQSVTQYDTAVAQSADTYNREFRAFAPMNLRSAYDDGYRVRLGPANDPAYSAKDGLFVLHYLYLEREVWLDATDGWLAVVDGAAGYAMVERFSHSEAEYPGKATVIFYTNGPALEFNDKGIPFLTSSNPAEMPYYMEAEVNSPMVRLNPGETYALDTHWFPTRSGGDLETVTDAGVVTKALTAATSHEQILLSGSFGVFFPGSLTAYLFDGQGVRTGIVLLQTVSPLDGVDVHKMIPASPGTARISIHLIDEYGADRGALGEASISKVERAP